MATLYFINGGVDNNWGTAGNWASTSGGTHVAEAVPTNADDVILDANSPNCTLNTSNRVCKSINFTNAGPGNYSNTITFTFALTVSGSVTLSSTMVFAGAGNFVVNATATLTSNGKTMPQPFFLQGTSITYTLADNWAISGLFTCNGTTTTTINGSFTITASNGYTQTTVATVTGAASLKLTGGTWTSTATNNVLRLNTELDGNITFNTNVAYNTGTLTYTSGTITTTGNTFVCAVGTTFNCNGMSFNNVNFTGAVTYTLSSNMDINGVWQIGTSTLTQTINGSQVNAGGGINFGTMSSGIVAGTTTVVIDGTGTLTPPTSTGQMRLVTTINASGSTITFGTTNSASIRWSVGGFTYQAGTIVSTGHTVDFSAITVTLNALFTVETIMLRSAVVFAGSNGFTTTNLTVSTTGVSHTLASTKTYTVTGVLTGTAPTSASHSGFVSSSGGSQAIFKLSQGATQDNSFIDATDIDSSTGQTVWTYKGTLSNATNWRTLPSQPQTITRGN